MQFSRVVPLVLGLIAPVLVPGSAGAETLTVSFETTPVGGSVYAPFNIVAVWIEDADGNFVKTIGRHSQVRTQHLVAWSQASGTDTDAVSGATRLDHNTALTFEWDLKDRAGNLVPMGTYTVRMECADDNSATPDQNNQGTFTFEHNGTESSQDLEGGGFLNVNLTYDPTPAGNGDGGGSGDGNGDGSGDGNGGGNGAGANGGVAIGTCQSGGPAGGLGLLLVVAVAFGARRRRAR